MKIKNLFNIGFIALSVLFILCSSCNTSSTAEDGKSEPIKSTRAGINEVIVHIGADAQKLNPITSNEAYATEIQNSIFQKLLEIDANTLELVPMLAISRPVITPIEKGEYKGGITMDFEIRPEAKWDNGDQITGNDVAFTLKAYKNPKVDCEPQRPYLEFVDHIEIDKENPRKFRVFGKDRYILSEISIGTTDIIPEYVYDPKKLMRNFTVKELNNSANATRLKGNKVINDFANEFNSEKYQREAGFVVGSGPYKFVDWATNQRIILEKKKNWWGDQFVGKEAGFYNYPDKLQYEIIVDNTTTLTALKDEKLDAVRSFKTKDFVDLKENKDFQKIYNQYSPQYIANIYVGLNMKSPKLSDKRVRQALSYALDKKYIMETFYFNLGEPLIGPIHPSKKYYHKGLTPYGFDLEKAKKLLDEAGWVDSDNDGLRDKTINGKKVPLKLEFKYPTGGTTAENVGLIFQKNAKKIGIDITLVNREWTVFLDESKAHKIEMTYGSWVNNPVPDDPYQLWHTESYNGGSNYVGFGNTYSDKLIERLRYELDEEKRNKMYLEFQEIIYEEAPYIFIMAPLKKLATHKRFKGADGKVTRPGYEVTQFLLDPGFGSKPVVSN